MFSETERQHVARDYAQRLYRGRNHCEKIIARTMWEKFGLEDVKHCDYLNISVCEPSTQQLLSYDKI